MANDVHNDIRASKRSDGRAADRSSVRASKKKYAHTRPVCIITYGVYGVILLLNEQRLTAIVATAVAVTVDVTD